MNVTPNPIGKYITVAMITKNEEQAVAGVIEDIKSIVSEAEILIVDSSQDETPVIAKAHGAKVIRQFPPRGYGPAMEHALRAASRPVIITLDCDNTYPAHKIPELASLILKENYDLVDASRLEKKPQAMPWLNYLGNLMFAWLASLLFFRRLNDLHSGMRAYRKTMLDNLEFDAKGAALPVELLLKPIISGYKVHTIFIDYHERVGQSKMNALDTSWWTLKRILKVRMQSIKKHRLTL
ncbi:putative glucosyl-3-phosphoglycerate synthase [Legionella busanensis]|uniref:Putative glucosyl-3-phosphoglycerate synthase n=1 Tax=Legionella busanensis TaxID=190655 RepID=A0A378JP01_9GAMM|nr:glycosyltransferase family 2 protein [Legionella busanensis]STX52408.1 putative glucosyl-3-phosphoglycerate synthase [Legionella busanensis]